MLPRYEVAARLRPVDLWRPGPVRAPYAAVTAERGPLELAGVEATFDDRVTLHVDGTSHRSRRSGRPEAPVEAVALTLTGPQVTAFTRERGTWVARARCVFEEQPPVPTAASHELGRFGQLGLRDLRVVDHDGDELLLTATSAGPGGFPTGHTSVWALDRSTLGLEHRADLFLRRGGRVYGDHAAHLLRDGGRWLLAASTWGDFEPDERPVSVVLATSSEDLTRGVHVLDAEPLALPTDGFRSVGVWDPHLARTDDGWLVGYVSARRYFRFHPVLAAGPSLDALTVRAVGAGHETEGTTLARLDGEWRVLASDKHRRAYPVLDLDLREVGTLDAAYPSNIPWPTLAGDLLIGFDGTAYGGRVVGYGSHGDVVVQRAVSP
ncbi:hypothetical protein G5V58_24955 [Nocardioides anomalus]|uniref:Uncharacterized protein n=1 Tax=Nocardioides anomalus TaxID=2712223 RepID=A0A6G6WJP9_9ACTN|nr:hypothetical protein [Nocardioides anomalus]QIG45561.1 hypothetical protein G5V58_24955 [Nocardioides anomalus]